MYSRAIPACKQFIILKQKIGWDRALQKVCHDWQFQQADFIRWFNEYKIILKNKADKVKKNPPPRPMRRKKGREKDQMQELFDLIREANK